ncbi:hypothetical protein P7C70_g7972, partial [Phenoliferia sp. Uapishka_3]
MAAHQNVRPLSLQERFELHAPYVPTITLTTLYKPDFFHYDLIASSSTGNFYLRTMPHSFERAPRWSPDALCPVQILRSICEFSAKLIQIPPGHPALKQYEEGLVTHMIEGGAKVDVHGKGEVRINLYGFAESKWTHPQITADFTNTELQGYISECLLEMSVDGVGRLRALGLARLQEVARWPGGLGITSKKNSLVLETLASPEANGTHEAVGETLIEPSPTNQPIPASTSHSPAPSTSPTTESPLSTAIPTSPAPRIQPSSSTPRLSSTSIPPLSATERPPPVITTPRPTSPLPPTKTSPTASLLEDAPKPLESTTKAGASGTLPKVSPTGTKLEAPLAASPTSTTATSAPGAAAQGSISSTTPPTPGATPEKPQATARAQAAARAKQSAAHAAMRHSSPPSGRQEKVGAAANAASGPSGTKATRTEGTHASSNGNLGGANGVAGSGSRKRKSTSPRTNLRADTEDLFNKSQKLRQTHDWRTENGPGGRTANDWRSHHSSRSNSYPSTPAHSTPRPIQHNDKPLARTPHPANLPSRPSSDTTYHQHHLNRDCRGGQQNEGARPSRFDQETMAFVQRYVVFGYPATVLVPYYAYIYRTLNYGQPNLPSHAGRATQCRPVVVPTDPRLLWRPLEAPSGVASNGTPGSQEGYHDHASATLAPPPAPFDRVISPPPHSNYSTRGNSTRSQASDFFLPPPRNYTTSQLTRDPHRQLPPNYRDLFPRATYGYDETTDFAPVTHPMEVGRPVELVAGGVELVDEQGAAVKNSDVVAKLEEGQVIHSDLSGGEWQVVGEGRKTSKWVDTQAQTTPTPVAGPSRLPGPSRPPTQGRLPPRRAAVGKSKLSEVYNADEDSGTDMETGSSGEFLHHRSEAWELTKIGRQNELDVGERKTRAQRRFKASQKQHWQEKLSRWEEQKKMNRGGNTKDARRRFWVEEFEQ